MSKDTSGDPVDASVIECWRTNYGLDKPPQELRALWASFAPPGAVLALKAAVSEIERLTEEVERLRMNLENTRAEAVLAVAKERERCAVIVERVDGWVGVREVAAEIRKG